ncbi:hypothetical protein Hanom_Chr02g00145641 [Helianthus anomalus]
MAENPWVAKSPWAENPLGRKHFCAENQLGRNHYLAKTLGVEIPKVFSLGLGFRWVSIINSSYVYQQPNRLTVSGGSNHQSFKQAKQNFTSDHTPIHNHKIISMTVIHYQQIMQ